MAWINWGPHFCPSHRAMFVFPLEQLDRSALDEIMASKDVEHLVAIIRTIVAIARPELSGIIIEYVDIDYARATLMIGCTHEKLPASQIGERCPEIVVDLRGKLSNQVAT